MSDIDKKMQVIPENNKGTGLSYVYTDSGLELPVLDITHPLFISSIDEEGLEVLCKESAQRAKSMKEIPNTQRQALIDKSLIFGRYFHKDPNARYLSGMSTFMLKLGPHLIGGGEERHIDKMISMGVISAAVRMRLRDICRLQADALIPQLTTFPQKELCFINIAGGTAIDSINTLILIHKENQSLLKNRKIEVNVFDIDTDSPNFARRCLDALKAPRCYFHTLDISFNHFKYNWGDTSELSRFMSERKDRILIAASEGGLFEYGRDEDIIENLNSLFDNSPDDTLFIGSFILDADTVDPTMSTMAEESGGALRLLGEKGFNYILEKTKWNLHRSVLDKNPIYVIFTLKKN